MSRESEGAATPRAGEGLSVERDGATIRVAIDRPPGNLFTSEMCAQLAGLLETPPDGVHVVRVTGSNGVFCLGRERPGANVEDLRPEVAALVRLNTALSSTRLVTVAEVTGDAAGFGVGIAALSDVALCSLDAQFSFPEIAIGLAPSLVLAWLERLVGRRTAFWLTATGEKFGAERAVALGIVNEATGPGALARRVDDVVAAISARPAHVHAEIKEMLRLFAGMQPADVVSVATDRLILGSLARLMP